MTCIMRHTSKQQIRRKSLLCRSDSSTLIKPSKMKTKMIPAKWRRKWYQQIHDPFWNNGNGISGVSPRSILLLSPGDVVHRQFLSRSSTRRFLFSGKLPRCSSLVVTPTLAFIQVLNGLVGQAMGSNNPKMAGVWLQQSMFWLALSMLPFLAAFFYGKCQNYKTRYHRSFFFLKRC